MESVSATGEARIIEPRRDATYRTKKSSPRAKRTPEQSDELIRSKVNCNGTTYYKCRDCDKVFTTSYNFLTHRNRHTGEKPFTCHVCGKNFRHGSVLNRHLRDVHAGSKDFPCDLCDRRLASRSARDEHRRTHTGERPHVCETCGKSFKQRASLHVHKRFSHTEAKYAHPCEICERAFQRKQELEKHLLIHTGQKPHVCTICEKRFRTIGCLSRHGKTHSDLKIHACERCGMKFGQQRYLKNHARNVHGTTNHAAARLPTLAGSKLRDTLTSGFTDFQKAYVNLFGCTRKDRMTRTELKVVELSDNTTKTGLLPQEISAVAISSSNEIICNSSNAMVLSNRYKKVDRSPIVEKSADKRSISEKCAIVTESTASRLRSNVVIEKDERNAKLSKSKVRRSANGPYSCDLCGKKFRLRDSLKTHARIHTGEKQFTCHICGKQFAQTGCLYYHLKHVHGGVKNHSCDICGRSFAMKTTMEDHRRSIHTGERPFVCDSCGKTFKTKSSLYIHSRIHTETYPHECKYCNKVFRWRQQLLGHLTIHTGEKKHSCDVCGKAFGVKNHLTRHKRTHSAEKPYACQQCDMSFGQKRYLTTHERLKHR